MSKSGKLFTLNFYVTSRKHGSLWRGWKLWNIIYYVFALFRLSFILFSRVSSDLTSCGNLCSSELSYCLLFLYLYFIPLVFVRLTIHHRCGALSSLPYHVNKDRKTNDHFWLSPIYMLTLAKDQWFYTIHRLHCKLHVCSTSSPHFDNSKV